jgi:hypothetical protein
VDQRLTPGDAALVRQVIAATYLSASDKDPRLGEIVLEPHQLDAVAQLLELLRREGGAVLADATGMGKTFVALAVSRAVGRTIVVAPAALREMWRESLRRSGLRARVESYESLSRGAPTIDEQPHLLVLDEGHHARNPASLRYVRLADLAWGSHVLILSATPLHNRRRDLRALLALFAGSRANDMSDDEVRRYIVRRTGEALTNAAMPSIDRPAWLDVPRDPETLCAIENIPPAVPAADGAPAHALMILGLIRAWSSSEAALRATLKRRLRRIASYFAALDVGRLPVRRELDSWPVVDDAIQLGFPALFTGDATKSDIEHLRDGLVRHQAGVRSVLQAVDRSDGRLDRMRAAHLASIAVRHAVPVVAFSQFADTARSMFSATAGRGGVALVTGTGSRIASGTVSTEEIVRGFDVGAKHQAAMPLDLLVATDVLSEGLSLRRAGVIVHLDVPWTLARLEQRVGRLRRLGSPHRCIYVYAIGPPIASGELSRVLRALQRKARLTSSVVDDMESASSVPLFGSRLERATALIVRRGDAGSVQRLRQLLGGWVSASDPAGPHTRARAGLALLRKGIEHKLLAIGAGVSDRTADVSSAVESLGGPACAGGSGVSPHSIALLNAWIAQRRARDLVRPALDAPSMAHVGVLQALQEMIRSAPRAERTRLSERVETCRALVTGARGVGAELALQRLLRHGLQLDALEELLRSRRTVVSPSEESWRVLAVIESGADQRGIIAVIDESMHPGRRQSSTDHREPAAARG